MLLKQEQVSPKNIKATIDNTLRILGPSNGGVGTCVAGVRGLKIGTFEGSGYLGYDIICVCLKIKDLQIPSTECFILGLGLCRETTILINLNTKKGAY